MKNFRILGLFAFMAFSLVSAQPNKQFVEITVVPVENDWVYDIGVRADFKITVTKNGRLLSGVELDYEIGLEGMPTTIKKTGKLSDKPLIVKGIELKDPGFVRCEVTLNYLGKKYRGIGAAGYEPYKIKPTVNNPSDFDGFWDAAKQELAKMPMEPRMTLQPNLSTDAYDVYHVRLNNVMAGHWRNHSYVYGMLSVPKGEGPFPANLSVPGAGVRSYGSDERARDGIISFKIGIHGIPVNLGDEIYDALGNGALGGYSSYNLGDKDKYYYKRVYLGCIRAVDFIYSLPQFDGENLIVSGGSQGGALSIVTAALDDRVKGLVSFYPALSDMTGYLNGRVGGWPHAFKNVKTELRDVWSTNAGYYDVVNFAKRLRVPGWYSWGYNDPVCPPTTTFAVYNSISAPKELHLFEETGHWTYPEQWEMANTWITLKLNRQN